MKPSEKEVLDTLRKTTLAYLSESDYAHIEKSVEQQGILNLTGTASAIVKSAVQKHGSHDQSTHGSWANGSGGGSRSWEEMMSNPIEGEKYRRGGSSSDPGGNAKGPQTREAWNKEEDELSAQFERNLDITTSDAQGMAMAQMNIKYGAKARSSINKATSVKTGDMVSWNSSGGKAQGKVVRVISSGKINVPDSSFEIEGTEDDPAALIQLYRDGKPTETKVGHKVSTLKKN